MGDTKYVVHTAQVYEEDVISKSGQNGPLSSARWHSIECQNIRSSQKLKMLGKKKTVLKRMLFHSGQSDTGAVQLPHENSLPKPSRCCASLHGLLCQPCIFSGERFIRTFGPLSENWVVCLLTL